MQDFFTNEVTSTHLKLKKGQTLSNITPREILTHVPDKWAARYRPSLNNRASTLAL